MSKTGSTLAGALFIVLCASAPLAAEGEQPVTPPGATANAIAVAESAAISPPIEPANPPTDKGQETATNTEPQTNPEIWRAVVAGLRPGYWDASILPVQGVAMYYNPGVFQQVLDFRYEHDHITACDECIGYVALLRAGDIDRRVWLQRQGRIAEGPFWVVDVAAQRDIPGLLEREWVVDIDHNTAMRWRMAGPIPITVYAAESPEAQDFAAAYFSSEMIPLDERYIIPPEAYGYRGTEEDDTATEATEATTATTAEVVAEIVYGSNWVD